MDVELTRRWGNTQPGEVVTVDDVQGRWLVDNGYGAAAPGAVPAPDEHRAWREASLPEDLPESSGSSPKAPPPGRRKAARPKS